MNHRHLSLFRRALLFLPLLTASHGLTGAGFERVFKQGETLLPGSDSVLNGTVGGGFAVGEEFVLLQSYLQDGVSRDYLLGLAPGQAKTVYDLSAGFPGGGTNLGGFYGLVGNGDAVYWGLTKSESPRDGVVLRYDGTTGPANVPAAQATLGGGNGDFSYSVRGVSSDGRIFALTGFDAMFPHFIVRVVDGAAGVLAQESVTTAPGTGQTFQSVAVLTMSADGSRVAFVGQTADFEGLYVWVDGQIRKVIDSTDTYPGMDRKFASPGGLNRKAGFAPDGTLYFVAETFADRATDRMGLFAHGADGQTSLVFDNLTEVDGLPVGALDGLVLGDDGTAVLYTNSGRRFLRYADGELKTLFERGTKPFSTIPMLTGGEIYVLLSGAVGPGQFIRQLHRLDPATQSAELVYTFEPELADFSALGVVRAGSRIYMYNSSQVWGGTLAGLEPGAPVESVAFFLVGNPSAAPWYPAFGLGWIYATDALFPWVYSATAGSWLYLSGATLNAFWAWHPGLGWIYSSRQGVWPFYYSIDRGWQRW